MRTSSGRSIACSATETADLPFLRGAGRSTPHEGIELSGCLLASVHNPAVSVPPQYEEIDIGDEEPVRCLKNGLWFLRQGEDRFVVLLAPAGQFGQVTGMQFQVATANNPAGTRITQAFFKHLEESVLKAESYRGKILSLEASEHSYSGQSSGIKVHKLRTVERDQVILPRKTLDLLDRNVVQFVRQRSRLARFRLSTKKGILFYGPPGTGKTHTIHYLARSLEGHTTLLVTAEQVGLLGEYMTLARLLQPSIVVIEDVDLIARIGPVGHVRGSHAEQAAQRDGRSEGRSRHPVHPDDESARGTGTGPGVPARPRRSGDRVSAARR